MESVKYTKRRVGMSIAVKRSEDYKISQWSGGKTRELMIYPDGTEYAKRNFIFRLSSATVECERSDFTALPNVERLIMPLVGKLELSFGQHGQKTLLPFEQARFDGGWDTTSIGMATDFNLMLREGAEGSLTVLEFDLQEKKEVSCEEGQIVAVFVAEGSCRAENNILEKDSLLVMQGKEKIIVENYQEEVCKLVCAKIKMQLHS